MYVLQNSDDNEVAKSQVFEKTDQELTDEINQVHFLDGLEEDKVISKDDWHLCEGFLNVFIKQDTLR